MQSFHTLLRSSLARISAFLFTVVCMSSILGCGDGPGIKDSPSKWVTLSSGEKIQLTQSNTELPLVERLYTAQRVDGRLATRRAVFPEANGDNGNHSYQNYLWTLDAPEGVVSEENQPTLTTSDLITVLTEDAEHLRKSAFRWPDVQRTEAVIRLLLRSNEVEQETQASIPASAKSSSSGRNPISVTRVLHNLAEPVNEDGSTGTEPTSHNRTVMSVAQVDHLSSQVRDGAQAVRTVPMETQTTLVGPGENPFVAKDPNEMQIAQDDRNNAPPKSNGDNPPLSKGYMVLAEMLDSVQSSSGNPPIDRADTMDQLHDVRDQTGKFVGWRIAGQPGIYSFKELKTHFMTQVHHLRSVGRIDESERMQAGLIPLAKKWWERNEDYRLYQGALNQLFAELEQKKQTERTAEGAASSNAPPTSLTVAGTPQPAGGLAPPTPSASPQDLINKQRLAEIQQQLAELSEKLSQLFQEQAKLSQHLTPEEARELFGPEMEQAKEQIKQLLRERLQLRMVHSQPAAVPLVALAPSSNSGPRAPSSPPDRREHLSQLLREMKESEARSRSEGEAIQERIEALRQAVERLRKSGLEEEAASLRRKAEMMELELRAERERQEHRVQELHEMAEQMRREGVLPRDVPGSPGAFGLPGVASPPILQELRELRKEVRQVRGDVAELRKLVERTQQAEKVNVEIEKKIKDESAEPKKAEPNEEPKPNEKRGNYERDHGVQKLNGTSAPHSQTAVPAPAWEPVPPPILAPHTSPSAMSPAELAIERSLRKRITIRKERETFNEIIRVIATLAATNIVVESSGLEATEIKFNEKMCSLHAVDVPLADALDIFLRPLNLAYLVEDDVLKITSAVKAVDTLKRKEENRRAAPEQGSAVAPSGPVLLPNYVPAGSPVPQASSNAIQHAPPASMLATGPGVIVHSDSRLGFDSLKVYPTLEANSLEKHLLTSRVTMHMTNSTLYKILMRIGAQVNVRIEMDNKSLETVGTKLDERTFSIDVDKVPAADALQQLLEPLKLSYVVDRGAVIIMTEDAAKGRLLKQR